MDQFYHQQNYNGNYMQENYNRNYMQDNYNRNYMQENYNRNYYHQHDRQEYFPNHQQRRYNGAPGFWRKRGKAFNAKDTRKPYDARQRQGRPHNRNNSVEYPDWEVQAATRVLQYCSFDTNASSVFRRNGITLQGQIAHTVFNPNPKWHCTREEYTACFLPRGGAQIVQNDEVVEVKDSGLDTSEDDVVLIETEKRENDVVVVSEDGDTTDSDEQVLIVEGDSTKACHSKSTSSHSSEEINIIHIDDVTSLNDCDKFSGASSAKTNSSTSGKLAKAKVSSCSKLSTPPKNTQPTSKCDYCDYTTECSHKMLSHLQENKHYSGSRYESVVEGKTRSFNFVTEPMKTLNKFALNENVAVVCPICPHEVFENIFLCSVHCDVMHNEPNVFALSDVVWKGKCRIDRDYQCSKCMKQFDRLKNLYKHWRQEVDHIPGNMGQFMNNDHIVFFYCSYCPWAHWNLNMIVNHAFGSHSKEVPEFCGLVMRNNKKRCEHPPVKNGNSNVHLLNQLKKLLTHNVHLHGAKSQAAKKVREKIAYHNNFVQ